MAEAVQQKVPPRPPPVEAKPIVGGRLWIPILGLVLLGIMANPKVNFWVSQRFAPQEPHSHVGAWKVGSETKLHVTLVTADFERLACAHADLVDGAHCAFGADEKPWPRDPSAPVADDNPEIIQPFRTSPENHLILIAGLWANPAVAMRLHREPPETVPVKRLNRFEAECQVKFIGEMKSFKLRWEVGAAWGKEPRALVARPTHCEIVR
jgi:hypothetical protein